MRRNKLFFVIRVGVFLYSSFLLAGCGDDVNASIPLISVEHLVSEESVSADPEGSKESEEEAKGAETEKAA